MHRGSPTPARQHWIAVTAFACLAFLLAASRINVGLIDSSLPPGTGLTPDESFNVQQGVYLVQALGQHGPLLWTPDVAQQVYQNPNYLPDHPPLGRWLLGMTHELTAWAVGGAEQSPFNITAARLGSCFALALTVALLFRITSTCFDSATAWLACLLLLLMPRVVGHARLAALETATGLMWLAALAPVLKHFTRASPPRALPAILAGICWGLLLLTKIQAILLTPVVGIWLLVRFRLKGLLPLVIWGTTGLIVFFLGWPWLWSAPWSNFLQYLGRAADRQELFTWYLGQRFVDYEVPWHYPLVMTLATLPVITSVGLIARCWQRKWQPAEQLLLLSVAIPLLTFSVPGTPVYDGTRLFLIVMPAIAVLAARGLMHLWGSVPAATAKERTTGRTASRVLLTVVAMSVAIWTLPAITSPFAISRYSACVSGGFGAERLGLESSYWGDGLNASLWETVPEGSEVFVAPVSHQFQLTDLEALVPIIRQRRIKLTAFGYDSTRQRGLLLLVHRLADLRPSLQSPPQGSVVRSEIRSDGRVLVQLLDTTNADWVEIP